MLGLPHPLLNTDHIELWPAHVLRARGNAHARVLARARTVLRRKRDGVYLAACGDDGLVALVPRLDGEPGIEAARSGLAQLALRTALPRPARLLPVQRLNSHLASLGLDADAYAVRSGLPVVAEPAWLADAGRDRYQRPLWLEARAARSWARMRAHALHEGVQLEAISGYRSHDYQLGIFARKLARGLGLDDILTVNAAPGFSEHHSGRALDIAAPGEPAADATFEQTAAFAWLREKAAGHGFVMSYPRDNPHGIVHEPWHWCHHASGVAPADD